MFHFKPFIFPVKVFVMDISDILKVVFMYCALMNWSFFDAGNETGCPNNSCVGVFNEDVRLDTTELKGDLPEYIWQKKGFVVDFRGDALLVAALNVEL